MHMDLLPPYPPPSSPPSSPCKLRTTPSYEHLVEALNTVGTVPKVPGFPLPEEEAAYLRCIETIVPYPSPPQEVRLAKAGCGLSGCREPDTVGSVDSVGAWDGKTEDGEARFGCPVCKAEEAKAEGEFWVEVAAGVGLPGEDYVEKEEGEGGGRMKRFRWGESAVEPLVYTPSPAEIARRNRPGPTSLPTMVIPQVSPPVPTPAPAPVPESMSIRPTMGRSRPTTLASPARFHQTTLDEYFRLR